MQNKKEKKDRNRSTIIVVILLVLLIIAILFFWNRSRSTGKSTVVEKDAIVSAVDSSDTTERIDTMASHSVSDTDTIVLQSADTVKKNGCSG